MKNTFGETHKKVVPGHIIGAGNNTLTLIFTHAPDLAEKASAVIQLDHPGATTRAIKTLSSGESGLGIVIENPEFEIDKQIVETLKSRGFSAKFAVNATLMHQFGELAQSLADQFFKSAHDVVPVLHIRSSVEEDGSSYRVESARFLMTGEANNHPFWRPNGI